MKYVVGLLVAVAALCLTGEVSADRNLNNRLQGDYAITTTRDCVESTAGFDANFALRPLFPTSDPAPTLRRTLNSDYGVIHYNGDGTGSSRIRSLFINVVGDVGTIPVSETESVCDITYQVSADGSVEEHSSCVFSVLVGGGANLTGDTAGIQVQRHITQGNTLLLTSAAPGLNVETTTIHLSPSSSTVRYRICTRSGVLSKISDD